MTDLPGEFAVESYYGGVAYVLHVTHEDIGWHGEVYRNGTAVAGEPMSEEHARHLYENYEETEVPE